MASPTAAEDLSRTRDEFALRSARDLFLISFTLLFFELTCIRWFGGTVIFLNFFTNLVLMACFLGMSVGCLAASRRFDWRRVVLPSAFASAVVAWCVLAIYQKDKNIIVSFGSAASASRQIFFGTEFRTRDIATFILPIEAVGGFFFTMIALTFIGLGQAMGREFDRIPNRVFAYSSNILGSLAGIAAFAIASILSLPPWVWFAVSSGLWLWLIHPSRAKGTRPLDESEDREPFARFVRSPIRSQFVAAGALIALVAWSDYASRFNRIETSWSPYNKIRYDWKTKEIEANNIPHQGMVRWNESGALYALPHLLNRDAGGQPFADVLVIGAGSGNDVQAALAMGAQHVDAVEIDPLLNAIGKRDHPDKPFSDPRVTIHLEDGRRFLKKTDRRYDLICYAVVDSLALHSGYSSLHLESYLFTEEALRDIKSRLKPGGMLAMYNYYRFGWVVGRLAGMAEKVFGTQPLVMTVGTNEKLPFRDKIGADDQIYNYFTYLLVGPPGRGAVASIRGRFEKNRSFWLNTSPSRHEFLDGFVKDRPVRDDASESSWHRVVPTTVEIPRESRRPTDDWPFLYLRDPSIPELNARWMGLLAILSLAILVSVAPRTKPTRSAGRMFFLGAGFMLLETKGVVHMALLFGSTWTVNSAVFASILLMILFANLLVLAWKPRKLFPWYLCLFGSLLLSMAVPPGSFLGGHRFWGTATSCAIAFAPLFFAGVVFASSFRESRRPDIDLGANIAGAILGGLSENASLLIGFNKLAWLALGYYLLSALIGGKLDSSASVE